LRKTGTEDRSPIKSGDLQRNMFARIWANLIGRIGGPMTFRLILQPSVAIFFAIRGGMSDAREGREPHAWAILTESTKRRELLRESWQDVAKVFLAAVIIDFIYQVTELRWFYPEEALIVATCLALLPYLLLRGPANRIARHWPQHPKM
jgi:hypothetical protein